MIIPYILWFIYLIYSPFVYEQIQLCLHTIISVRLWKMVGPIKQAFCPKINMLKGNFDTNYFEPLMIFSRKQKSEFLKLIVLLLHYFRCQIRVQWHKLSGKNTHIYFSYFWFKNKRVWAKKKNQFSHGKSK